MNPRPLSRIELLELMARVGTPILLAAALLKEHDVQNAGRVVSSYGEPKTETPL